jgi:hypothetical protein
MELGEKWPVNLACESDFHVIHMVLLHAANLLHGADGFTSPTKEGMLWIFSPERVAIQTELFLLQPHSPQPDYLLMKGLKLHKRKEYGSV